MYTVINTVGILGILVHAVYAPIFFSLDLPVLGYINIGSVITWISGWIINRKGYSFFAIILLTFEVAVHTIATVYYLGWESGFQYYLFGAIPFTMFNNRLKTPAIIFATSIITLLFVGLYHYSHIWQAVKIKHSVVELFFYTNSFITFFGIAISSFYFRYAASKSFNEVSFLANTDELTGLWNRRKANLELQRWLVVKEVQPFSLIICDIDDFKKVNDNHGHLVGDKVIHKVAKKLQENLRHHEMVSRWGGEEFLIALPNTELDHAKNIAMRIRDSINHMLILDHEFEIKITLTYGVTEYKEGMTLEELIRASDQKMYKGKQSGKDCVVA